MCSDFFARNAREVLEAFWKERSPEAALKRQQDFLALFSEACVSHDLTTLKSLPLASNGFKDFDALVVNLPLLYARQTIFHQSFCIIPRSDDGTFTWTSEQMSQMFDNTMQHIHDIPDITRQTASLGFLLRASQWELARAYYLAFYWFTTIGPQLASSLVHQVQTGYEDIRDPTPLQKLANHICEYVHKKYDGLGMLSSHLSPGVTLLMCWFRYTDTGDATSRPIRHHSWAGVRSSPSSQNPQPQDSSSEEIPTGEDSVY